jgi:hypothetical protein
MRRYVIRLSWSSGEWTATVERRSLLTIAQECAMIISVDRPLRTASETTRFMSPGEAHPISRPSS